MESNAKRNLLSLSLLQPDVQYQTLQNLAFDPGCFLAQAHWAGAAPNEASVGNVDSSWPVSKKAYKIAWSTRSHGTGDIGPWISSSTKFEQAIPYAQGRYTMVWNVVTSHNATSAQPILGNVSGGTATLHDYTPAQTIIAGKVTRQWLTFTRSSASVHIQSTRTALGGLPLQSGVWAEVSDVDLYLGDYQPSRDPRLHNPFVEGWGWTGAVNNSASTGYPYALSSIAGEPIHALTSPDTVVDVQGMGALSGRTMYTVWDSLGTGLQYQQLAATGANTTTTNASTSGVLLRTSASSNTNLEVRITADGGTSSPYLFGSNWRTPGRHVTAVRVEAGMTGFDGMHDTAVGSHVAARTAVMPGGGMTLQKFSLGQLNSDGGPVAAVVFGTPHNDVTMKRVMTWLGKKYNAPIPTGY